MLLCTNSKHFMQTKETTSLSRNRNGTPHTRNAFNTNTRTFQLGYYWVRINTEPIFPLWKFTIFCCCCEYILPHTSIKPSIVSLTLLRAHRPVLTHSNGRSLFIESIRDIDSVSFMLKKLIIKMRVFGLMTFCVCGILRSNFDLFSFRTEKKIELSLGKVIRCPRNCIDAKIYFVNSDISLTLHSIGRN